MNNSAVSIWLVIITYTYQWHYTLSSDQCSVATIFGLKTADCRNNNLKLIPVNIPTDTKVLRFTDNRLTYLGEDAFHAHQALQEIYVGRNRIEVIAPYAFRGLQNLQILDLEGNKLKAVPTLSFKHITSVRILSLKSNPITYLAARSFVSLTNLEELNLENCWLGRIHSAAFDSLSYLSELNVVNNELSTLPSEMETMLPHTLTILRLHRNPWICDCRLRWLRRFVASESPIDNRLAVNWNFAAHNTPVCSGPELIKGISWHHLTVHQFACPPTHIIGNGTTSMELYIGLNASIDCIIAGDPEPAIMWMKGMSYVMPKMIMYMLENISTDTSYPAGHWTHSILHLHEVSLEDAGDYKCIAVNAAGRSEITYKVIIIEKTLADLLLAKIEKPREGRGTTSKDGDDMSNGIGADAVLGAIVGTILLIVILLSGVSCIICVSVRKQNSLHNAHPLQKVITVGCNSTETKTVLREIDKQLSKSPEKLTAICPHSNTQPNSVLEQESYELHSNPSSPTHFGKPKHEENIGISTSAKMPTHDVEETMADFKMKIFTKNAPTEIKQSSNQVKDDCDIEQFVSDRNSTTLKPRDMKTTATTLINKSESTHMSHCSNPVCLKVHLAHDEFQHSTDDTANQQCNHRVAFRNDDNCNSTQCCIPSMSAYITGKQMYLHADRIDTKASATQHPSTADRHCSATKIVDSTRHSESSDVTTSLSQPYHSTMTNFQFAHNDGMTNAALSSCRFHSSTLPVSKMLRNELPVLQDNNSLVPTYSMCTATLPAALDATLAPKETITKPIGYISVTFPSTSLHDILNGPFNESSDRHKAMPSSCFSIMSNNEDEFGTTV